MDDFSAYFRNADANGNGLISSSEAASFFKRFDLPDHVMSQIWSYADGNKDSNLTREEFNNALKLISAAQFGHILTPELVEDVLHGPESDQIPAPEIRIIPIVGSSTNTSSNVPGHIPTPELVQDVFRGPESDQMLAPEIRIMPTASPSSSPTNAGSSSDTSRNEFNQYGVRTPAASSSASPANVGMEAYIQASSYFPGGSNPAVYSPAPAVHGMSPIRRVGCSSNASTNPFDSYVPDQHGFDSPRASSQELLAWPKFSQDDIFRYSSTFRSLVKDEDGRVTGAQACKLFRRWGLSSGVLKQIWDVSDLDMNGELTKKEFFLALYLMERHREGRLLPASLPSTLLNDEVLLQATGTRSYDGSGAMRQEWLTPADTTMSSLSSVTMKLQALYSREVERRKRAETEIYTLRQQRDAYEKQLKEAYEKTLRRAKSANNWQFPAVETADNLRALKFLLNSLQGECSLLTHEGSLAPRDGSDQHEICEKINCEFTYTELSEATQKFDDSTIIGEGGFGRVYRGVLRNTTVAIKMLNSENIHGRAQFKQEVEILGKVRHPNLVNLMGASPEACALVYEFLPNGNLEDRLNCTNDTQPLTWQDRTRIIGETCNALLFLHKSKPHPIVHGDVKPANVLLDANLISKLSDFGISHLLSESSSTNTALYITSKPIGTLAYSDPEYITRGELTTQSDVYSFGITILRILTGKQPRGIVKVVHDALQSNTIHLIVDKTAGEWPFVQAKLLAELGLWCADVNRKNRPDLENGVWKIIEPFMKLAVQRSSTAASDDWSCPPYFICPITYEIMRDPQFAADGFTYEADAIKEWLSSHKTSPMTNLLLPHCNVTPNLALRSSIRQYMEDLEKKIHR